MDYQDLTLEDFSEADAALLNLVMCDPDVFQHFASLNEQSDYDIAYGADNFTEYDYFVGMAPEFQAGLERLFAHIIFKHQGQDWCEFDDLLVGWQDIAQKGDEINRDYNRLDKIHGGPEDIFSRLVNGDGGVRPVPSLSIMQARTFMSLLLFNQYPEVFKDIDPETDRRMTMDLWTIYEEILGRGLSEEHVYIFARKMAVVGSDHFSVIVSNRSAVQKGFKDEWPACGLAA